MILVMSCVGCSKSLEELELMTEQPCCGLVMHSKCALKLVGDGSYDGISVYCPGCEECIWSHPLYVPNIASVPEACLEELKAMKSQISMCKKGFSTFRKKVNYEKRQYRDQIKPHVDAIRQNKKDRKKAISISSEYIAYKKIYRNFMKQMKELSVKYDVPMRALADKINLSYWRINASRYINTSFYFRA